MSTEPNGSASHTDGRHAGVALVLSGGGARGAYEVGVLSALAPILKERGERPRLIVGTSVGALNAAYLAAEAHRDLTDVVRDARRIWKEITYEKVLAPLLNVRELRQCVRYGLEFLGVPIRSPVSLLDNAPLAQTLSSTIQFKQLAKNVRTGVIDGAGVVATSYGTGRSVVFHNTAERPKSDEPRAIDYAYADLAVDHVRASAAIEALFPAVEITQPSGMDGWYGDGGTSLNTPLKPALTLGARRLIVIGLNSLASTDRRIAKRRADAFDGAAEAVQALFANQLTNDVATLGKVNQRIASRRTETHEGEEREPAGDGEHRIVKYMFVTPEKRFAIGRLANDIYRRHYDGWRGLRRARDLALLGRLLDAGRNPARGELFSYVFFAPEFTAALMRQGKEDAERWLAQPHDEGPWQVGTHATLGDPPSVPPRPPALTRTALGDA